MELRVINHYKCFRHQKYRFYEMRMARSGDFNMIYFNCVCVNQTRPTQNNNSLYMYKTDNNDAVKCNRKTNLSNLNSD